MVLNVSNAHICSQTPWTQWLLCQSIHVRVFADGQNIMMSYACINSSAKTCQFALSVTSTNQHNKKILIILYVLLISIQVVCRTCHCYTAIEHEMNAGKYKSCKRSKWLKNINRLTGAPTLFDRWLESDLSSQVSRTNGWDRLRRLSGFFKARMTRSPHWLA